MSKSKLLAVCLLVGTALSCGSDSKSSADGGDAGAPGAPAGGSDSGPGPGGNPDDSDATSTYLQVASFAKLVYDAVEAGEDVSPHIEAALGAFGVPVLEPDDAEGALARIEAGLPFVTSLVVERMAAAYAETRLVDAEGFVEGLAEQGVGLAFPYNLEGTEFDAAFFGALLYSYTASGEAEPDVPLETGFVLPSLVRELGQERARRMGLEEVDPAWGDGRLDPLQFTLLSFTIFAKPSAVTRALSPAGSSGLPKIQLHQGNPLLGLIKDQAEGVITSGVQNAIELPLDKQDAAKVSVCGSLILYGHKIAMTNTPDLLWHKPKAPSLTKVEMTLTFEDDYYDNWANAVLGSAVSDLAGCKFPRKGPIEGKPIEWSVSSGLEGHGSFNIMPAFTNEFGKALASWETVTDDYPEACQVFEKQRDAVGATEAVVSGLLPGWSTVETIVTFLNPETGGQGHDPLTVLYYEVTVDDTCHRE